MNPILIVCWGELLLFHFRIEILSKNVCTRYGTGYHAPGYRHPGEGIYKCAYVTLLAHAKAYHVYDDEFRTLQGGKLLNNYLIIKFSLSLDQK